MHMTDPLLGLLGGALWNRPPSIPSEDNTSEGETGYYPCQNGPAANYAENCMEWSSFINWQFPNFWFVPHRL